MITPRLMSIFVILQTGEMEVRNPLFNEDTPSASGPEENKMEDNTH